MHNTVRYSFLVFVLLLIPIPLFAENILEPEYMEVTEHQLTCEPQQDVDFHIFRVCRNKAMTRDCTQAIYKAKENGAMSIPSNNRCIYRVKKGNSYKLYYQIKAASINGATSQWTLPRRLNVYQEVVNRGTQSYSYFHVQYETDDPQKSVK